SCSKEAFPSACWPRWVCISRTVNRNAWPKNDSNEEQLSIELNSSAGRMAVDDRGRISFDRGGRIVLQSAPAPAFVLTYGVELPAQAVLGVERRCERVVIRYGTPKPGAALSLEAQPTASGFRLHWRGDVGLPAVGVAWSLRPQGPW